jgi:hypothetical protein
MSYGKPIALQWNQLTLDAVKYSGTSAPLAARALAMVHTAMYDAWSVYNSKAISTSTALYIKAPQHHCNKENVRKAFSYAAYRVLMDLFWLALPPEKKNMFNDFMCELTYNTDDACINTSSPQGIGNLADPQADHALDLGWGGPDELENLWPLYKGMNEGANAVYHQSVDYIENGEIKKGIPYELVGKWFVIVSIGDTVP